jgi:S1-C subfamily serine protease
VDLLDLIVILLAAAAALGGYQLGFLGRVVSWLGLGLGFYVAVRLLPSVIVALRSSSAGVQFVVAVLVLLGGALVGQAIGLLVGGRLHAALPLGPVRQTDRVLGAGLGVAVVVAVLWLLLPSMASFPGWAARETSDSAIARWVSRDLPTPPPAVQVVRRLLGEDAPQVFAVLSPGAPAGPVPSSSPLSPAVTAAVTASTVKVEGQACNLIYEGSGFAVAPDLIVTNAHVVAGEAPGQTSVLLPSGRTLPATVIMFDPRIDIALLDVPSLGENPLPLLVAHAGATGAVFGHPYGQDPIAVTPARVALEEQATGLDLYDTATVRRDVLVLAADLAHGDSGGPLVNAGGQVIGVAFAISADQPGTSYALSTTELEKALGEARNPAGVSTGSCLAG